MKASLKFREEQKPLFRAKVPLSILGLPFRSGIVAGESRELSLNLSTFFESWPSIKIGYRPNDAWNPFSLIVKTGTGPFGSPVSSSMLMSAEFNLLGRGNPAFMLHFKPQFGDFSIKKSQSSVLDQKAILKAPNGGVLENDDTSIEVVESPMLKKITVLPSRAAGEFAGVLAGVDMVATTALPVRSRAVVNFRWGVRVPAEITSESTAGINFKKMPYLVMNKIGVEHVDGADSKEKTSKKEAGQQLGITGKADVVEVCFNLKRQMEILQSENGLLKKAVEDLRREILDGKSNPFNGDLNSGKYREFERNGNNKASNNRNDRRNGEKKSMESDVNEELKRALKGDSGGA
ncbi:hypothetical protein KPL70_018271 [Citrus sinensis]|uniref:uncharacterized protein LOC102630624 n=1 Tax=Citrus sinensis TaxID=2711 RepID=UPI0003D74EF6|nr:uncharacterized protein LOC102630624 [Citrus sinensis]KAH9673889.1 hypothetical protein KPL70_018271 [Citrus sinensis]